MDVFLRVGLNLVRIGLGIENLLSILEPPNLRFGFTTSRTCDLKSGITLPFGNLGDQIGNNFRSLIHFQVNAGSGSFAQTVGGLAVVFSCIVKSG